MTLPGSSDNYVRLAWKKVGGQPTFVVVSGVASGSVLTIPGLEAGTQYEIRASLLTRQAYDLYRGSSATSPKWQSRLSGGGLGKSVTLMANTGNDPPVTVFYAPEVYRVDEGESVLVTVWLSADPEREVTVLIEVGDGTASVSDYSGVPPTVTFAAGETTKTFTVLATQDMSNEPGETVNLGFGALPDGVGEGSAPTAVVTIVNDTAVDDPGTPTIVDNDYPSVTVFYAPEVYRVDEGESVLVTVRLSANPEREVTVPIAVGDGTASVSDYSGVPAAVTFTAGETSKSFAVTATQDMSNEPDETVYLGFGTMPDGLGEGSAPTAIVTIAENNHSVAPVPAWSARFGRTAATHTMDPLGERLRCGSDRRPNKTRPYRGHLWRCKPPRQQEASLTLGGFRVDGGAVWAETFERNRTSRLPDGGMRGDRDAHLSRPLTGRDLLAGSAFHVSLAEQVDDGKRWILWGQGDFSSFEGRDSGYALGGNVVTGTLGLDYTVERWLAGMALSYSDGEGTFSQLGSEGEIVSSLTAFYPYLRYSVSERVSVWGATGYGQGTLSWDRDDRIETGHSMYLGAIGGRGELVAPNDEDGFTLSVKADALLLRMNADGVPGLGAADTNVSRLRLGLEGAYDILFDDGRWLAPFFEVVQRHDGGDAEKGSGVEIGGGVRLAHPQTGLTMELDTHVLLAHEAAGFREWGASAALRREDPSSNSGLSVALSLDSGTERSSWARETMAGIAANDNHPSGGRLDAELGYRFPALGRQGIGMPYGGLSLSRSDRDWRLGYRFDLAPTLTMNFQGTRSESVDGNDLTEHRIMLRVTAHW